jgi:hypothetical protein
MPAIDCPFVPVSSPIAPCRPNRARADRA